MESTTQKTKDDFNLVSTTNLREIHPPCNWGPGPDNLGQKCLSLPRL